MFETLFLIHSYLNCYIHSNDTRIVVLMLPKKYLPKDYLPFKRPLSITIIMAVKFTLVL